MKKLIAFILTIIPLFGISFLPNNSIFDLNGIYKVCFVTTEDVDNPNLIKTSQYNYLVVESNYKEINDTIDSSGIVVYIKNTDREKIEKSLNMVVFQEEEVENKQVIYGYTSKYSKSILLNEKKVNVQMVIYNDEIILGFPLILTGF